MTFIMTPKGVPVVSSAEKVHFNVLGVSSEPRRGRQRPSNPPGRRSMASAMELYFVVIRSAEARDAALFCGKDILRKRAADVVTVAR